MFELAHINRDGGCFRLCDDDGEFDEEKRRGASLRNRISESSVKS